MDNAPSNDLARQVVAGWGAAYLLEPTVGLSRACNVGARSCAGEIVAFIDDDAIPEAGWLAALGGEFTAPEVIAVTTRIMPLRTDAYPGCNFRGPEFGDRRRYRLRQVVGASQPELSTGTIVLRQARFELLRLYLHEKIGLVIYKLRGWI